MVVKYNNANPFQLSYSYIFQLPCIFNAITLKTTLNLTCSDFLKILCVLLPIAAIGQEDYYTEKHLRYANHVYESTIKTVQLYKTGNEDSQPIIMLNGAETITLHFDDLTAELRDFDYEFIHCNFDWTPSDIHNMEYIDGVAKNPILDYRYSTTLRQQYIHYSLTFPNKFVQFSKSGNYLLKVTDAYSGDLVLSRKFFVYQPKTTINPPFFPADRAPVRLA